MAVGAGRRAELELEGYASNHPAAGEVTADNKNNNLQSAGGAETRSSQTTRSNGTRGPCPTNTTTAPMALCVVFCMPPHRIQSTPLDQSTNCRAEQKTCQHISDCRTKRLTLPLEAPFRPRTASERATGYSETSSGPCKKYERNPRRDGGRGG
jgi:hypothetical protein